MAIHLSRWLAVAAAASIIMAAFVVCSDEARPSSEGALISRIAFGSCANQSAPQPIWDAIIDFDPQVFIWLGDNIYGDIRRPFKFIGKERTIGPWQNVPRFIPSSEQEMQTRYDKANKVDGYSRLRKKTKVIGTWDDHDYGLNDAGKEFDRKVSNQKLMLDFLDEPLNSPRRKQEGVYTSYTFGPSSRKIKVILLDTRYHRDALGSDGCILGDVQWTWLEKQLKGPASAITIIGSSIQVISNLSAVTRPLFSTESWGRFPKERQRLFKLIADSKRAAVFFISGDVHFGEINEVDCVTGYPLYDITSSGLTQAVENTVPRTFHFLVRFFAWFTPTTMRVINKGCRYKSCTYAQPNFGVIDINWEENPVSLKFEVRDTDGLSVTSVHTILTELEDQRFDAEATLNKGKHQNYCTLEVSLPWIVRYRLAIFSFCVLTGVVIILLGLVVVVVSTCLNCIRKCKVD